MGTLFHNPDEMAHRIAACAREWLKPRSVWMARAKREVRAFSPLMVELGLRELFAEISANVYELADEEATHWPLGRAPRVRFRRRAAPTVCHILSGNIPNAGIVSMIVGLLAGARNVVKPARGDPMPRLFAESLWEAAVDRRWMQITDKREAYRGADIVVAYGTEETLGAIRAGLRRGQKFFGFGHRVSIGIVENPQSLISNPRKIPGARFPAGDSRISVAALAARDVSMWDQQGCMSPQAFYVAGDAERFSEALAEEMERFDLRWPRAELSLEDSMAIARARHEWEFRGKVWASRGSTHWTVVLDEATSWAAPPLNRFVFVRSLKMLKMLPRQLRLSTIGLAGKIPAGLRAERICPLGEMQNPPLLPGVSRPRIGDLERQ